MFSSEHAAMLQQMQAELSTEVRIEPEGELIDWYWEISVRPDRLELTEFEYEDKPSEHLLAVDANSDEHHILYDLAFASGVLMHKLDSFHYSQDEESTLTLFFDTTWTSQDIDDIDSVLADSAADPVERIADLLEDDDACIVIRNMYDNCFEVLRFYELDIIGIEDQVLVEDGNQVNVRAIKLKVGLTHDATYARKQDQQLHDLNIPVIVLKPDNTGIEFDPGLYAYAMACSEGEVRDDLIHAAYTSEAAPTDDEKEEESAVESKPMSKEQKKKRNKKNKAAKRQRKKNAKISKQRK